MKKFMLIAMAAMIMVACGTKTENSKTTTVNYMEQYNRMLSDFESHFSSLSEEEQEVSVDSFMIKAFELQQQAAGDTASYRILSDIVYYLTTEQKTAAFAILSPDSLDQYGLTKHYNSLKAEQNTAVGMQYTDFGAETPERDSLYIHDLVGKTDFLIIDFWASWCGPCRASMPAMKELYKEANGRIEILGVSLDRAEENWEQAIEQLGLPWKHISDLKYWDCEGASLYGVSSIPTTVTIDRQGKIIGRNMSHEEIRALLQ